LGSVFARSIVPLAEFILNNPSLPAEPQHKYSKLIIFIFQLLVSKIFFLVIANSLPIFSKKSVWSTKTSVQA